MTRKEWERRAHMFRALASYGITAEDAETLRRISGTLSRWAEGECGTENGGAIERDDATGKPFWTYEAGNGTRGRYAIPDREAGALKRLSALMAKYPDLVPYHQTDPRGAAVYVCRREDVAGLNLASSYGRGIAVY